MKWLSDLNTTNWRIFTTMFLAAGTIGTVNVCLFMEKELPLNVLISTFSFLAVMAGVDYLQYAKKRETYIPSPPNPKDVEDKSGV
jgi:hypothetical protein